MMSHVYREASTLLVQGAVSNDMAKKDAHVKSNLMILAAQRIASKDSEGKSLARWIKTPYGNMLDLSNAQQNRFIGVDQNLNLIVHDDYKFFAEVAWEYIDFIRHGELFYKMLFKVNIDQKAFWFAFSVTKDVSNKLSEKGHITITDYEGNEINSFQVCNITESLWRA